MSQPQQQVRNENVGSVTNNETNTTPTAAAAALRISIIPYENMREISRICDTCNLTFQDEAALAIHQSIYCHKITKNGRPKRKKSKTSEKPNNWLHKKPKTIVCKEDQEAPINTNLWNNPWVCNMCGLKFRERHILVQHKENACDEALRLDQKVLESVPLSPRLQEQIDIEELAEIFVIDSNKLKLAQKQKQRKTEIKKVAATLMIACSNMNLDQKKQNSKEETNKMKDTPEDMVIGRKKQEADLIRGFKFCNGCRSFFAKKQFHTHETYYCEALKANSSEDGCEKNKLPETENFVILFSDKPELKTPVFENNNEESPVTNGDDLEIGGQTNAEPAETNKKKPVCKVRRGKKKKSPTKKNVKVEISGNPEFKTLEGTIQVEAVETKTTTSSEIAKNQMWVCVKCRLPFVGYSTLELHQENGCKALHLKPKVYQNHRSTNSAVRQPSVIVGNSQTTEQPLIQIADKLTLETNIVHLKVEDEEPQIKSEPIEDGKLVVDAFGGVQHQETDCQALHLKLKVYQNPSSAYCAVRTPSEKPVVEIEDQLTIETNIVHLKVEDEEPHIKNEPIEDDELVVDGFGGVYTELCPEFSQNVPDLKCEIDLEEYTLLT